MIGWIVSFSLLHFGGNDILKLTRVDAILNMKVLMRHMVISCVCCLECQITNARTECQHACCSSWSRDSTVSCCCVWVCPAILKLFFSLHGRMTVLCEGLQLKL